MKDETFLLDHSNLPLHVNPYVNNLPGFLNCRELVFPFVNAGIAKLACIILTDSAMSIPQSANTIFPGKYYHSSSLPRLARKTDLYFRDVTVGILWYEV